MKLTQVRHYPRSGTRQLYVATFVHAVDLVAENDFALAHEMLQTKYLSNKVTRQVNVHQTT